MNQNPYRRNIPLFIAFRVLFNARWYYPVLAILFLDLGLSIEQYALLNVAWAAAIVGFEVPSGALADRFGRKKMVVISAILMVIEMLVFSFAPRGNPSLLFAFFFLNRILSGAAEASASGADEALAYDSLPVADRDTAWPHVLARMMRWQYGGFFVAMLVGAAVYDVAFLQRMLDFLRLPWHVTPQIATHLPLYLTLGNAILVLLVTLNFREPVADAVPSGSAEIPAKSPKNAWTATIASGRWILATPAVFGVIAIGFTFDSIVRVFIGFSSTYFRIIHLPDATFGLIGSGFAVIGFMVPTVAQWMVEHWPMRRNFTALGVLIFLGFLGCTFETPIYGLIWIIPMAMAMAFIPFFVSHYLNLLVTDSSQRATILSFRGLAFNLAYGMAGLLFAGLTSYLRMGLPVGTQATANLIFTEAMYGILWYFAFTALLLVLASRMKRFR